MEVKSVSHKAQWPPPEAEGARFCLQTFEDQSCELHWESRSAGLQAARGNLSAGMFRRIQASHDSWASSLWAC